jgi:hypothetical protein
MSKRPEYFKLFVLVALGLSQPSHILSSPLYGGEKYYYDKSAVAPEFRPKQVQLAAGTAECVRTAWIGDVRNRTLICVEWRRIRQEGK